LKAETLKVTSYYLSLRCALGWF